MQSISRLNSILIWSLLISVLISNEVKGQNINGISFSAPATPALTKEMFEDMKTTHANWVALIPEATLERNTLDFLPDDENDCWGETIDANVSAMELAKEAGLKIFVKPHIVLGTMTRNDKTQGAEWRGDLMPRSEADWMKLEKNYEAYILELARVSEEYDVDLFSIGTELKMFTRLRPNFWKKLIKQVRNIYSGELTYSANWDEYQYIYFWKDLDIIGIDMYFPISDQRTPSVRKTTKKWKSIAKRLKKTSEAYNRKILLAEYGYRNIPYAGKRPWTHDKGEKVAVNNEAQSNLYEALFQAFWNEPWVAGGFAWKWFAHPKDKDNTSFTVQDKPALEVLKKWYASN